MDTSLNIQPATPETVWALLQEIGKKHADLAERQAETDKLIKNNSRNIADLAERQAETDRLIKETNRLIKESQAETDRLIKETAEQMKEAHWQIKEIKGEVDLESEERQAVNEWKAKQTQKLLDEMYYDEDRYVEAYFLSSFDSGKKNFFGEEFDDIIKDLKGMKTDDVFDIVMFNDQSACIVKIIFQAREKDIPRVLGQVDPLRANFPTFQNHRIYLGLTTMDFTPELEKACKENGIAIIKLSGDRVVINYEHLKAF